MQDDFGYAERDMKGKPYDIRLLRRLLPFVLRYKWFTLGSVFLVIMITILDLSIPFITKVAIDRYIVPETADTATAASGGKPLIARRLSVSLADPEVRGIVARYPELFDIEGSDAQIDYDDLSEIVNKDTRKLRRNDLDGLGGIAMIFLLAVALSFIFNFLQNLLMEYSGHWIMHDLRMHLYRHVQSLSVSFFSRNPVARLVTRLTNDIQNMHELFTSVLSMLFKDLFLLVGIAVVLLFINWRLALVSFAILPIVVGAAFTFSSRIRDIFRESRIKIAEINTHFSETVDGIKVIQSFVKEDDNSRRFSHLNHENYILGVRQVHIFALFMPIIEVLGVVSVAIVIYHGGGKVLRDTLSLGDLVAFISYIRMFFRPIRDLAEKYNILQNAMASAERIFHLMDNQEKLTAPSRGVAGGDAVFLPLREIRFENVSFSYVDDETILDRISFRLKAGETLAVVGPTGSGKTTLIHLMLRFYDPGSGKIRINGLDIADVNPEQLRTMLALVPQDPFLFTGTVRENILLDHKKNSEKQLRRIVTAASCGRLVRRLPDGLDTHLTKGGASLSSGERQLISIARAFVRNPALIILDEATSYVDSQTEVDLHHAMDNLMSGRTSIIIAHRLTTARGADHIMVMNHGSIVEMGRHDELMARKGFYHRMVQYQNGVDAKSAAPVTHRRL